MGSGIEHIDRSERVVMIGLDFGSTTSSAMVATADVGLRCATGRMAFELPCIVYRSEPVFTPFNNEQIDSTHLVGLIDRWIAESGIDCKSFFAGGVIITGLAAKRSNAAVVARLIGERIGDVVVATADDPCLESWLAFMGNCSVLSRFHAETPFINLDIGGGTTNPAYGINGSVLHTGCCYVGARHFLFEPGTYRLTGMSSYGRELLNHLGIEKEPGQHLTASEIEAILDFYIAALEAVARGDTGFFSSSIGGLHQQVPFSYPPGETPPVLVFSGGVGELVYRAGRGKGLPGTTYYGDLGIDLAGRIVQSPLLAARVKDLVPENQGRATVYGLTLHSTEISGSTIFLSSGDILPLRDLPIVARLPIDTDSDRIHRAVLLGESGSNGACLQILAPETDGCFQGKDPGIPAGADLKTVKSFGERLREACMQVKPRHPVVVLAPYNYGQALGNYASNWRQDPFDMIVIDEIPDRQAHFVNIGRLHNNIVPVSFYGIC